MSRADTATDRVTADDVAQRPQPAALDAASGDAVTDAASGDAVTDVGPRAPGTGADPGDAVHGTDTAATADVATVDAVTAASRRRGLSADPIWPAPRPGVISALARWLPGVVLAVVVVGGLLAAHVAASDVARFAAVWAATVTVPGLLVSRALLGPRATLVADLAVGTATGVALGVVTGVGLQVLSLDRLHWVWWAAVYVVWALVPPLRRAAVGRYRDRVPAVAGWGLAAGTAATLVTFAAQARIYAPGVPPTGATFYTDLWWHLSLTQEMLKPGVPQFPQVVGEPMRYHWFANQHLAMVADTAGLAPELVLVRLWPVIMLITALGLTAALAWRVGRRPWTGPLAVWLTAPLLVGGMLWPEIRFSSVSPFHFTSPSQLLANVVTVAAAFALIDVVRGRLGGLGWVWLTLIAAAGAGAKPTVLPLLVGGTGLAALAATVLRRRGWVGSWVTTGALAVGYLVSSRIVAGSTEGNIVGLALLRLSPQYRAATGDVSLNGTNDGFWLSSLSTPGGWWAAAATLLWLGVTFLPRLLGLGLPFLRGTRRDPAAWWFAGASLAGYAALLVVDHPGVSQVFFGESVASLGAVATAWFAAAGLDAIDARAARRDAPRDHPIDGTSPPDAAGADPERGSSAGRTAGHDERPARRPGRWAPAVLAVALGALVAQIAIAADTHVPDAEQGPLDHLVRPAAVAVLAGVVVWGAARLVWRTLRLPSVGGVALVVAASVGLGLPAAVQQVNRVAGILTTPVPIGADASGDVTVGEQMAALWVRDHAAERDVLATNVHCRPPQYRTACDSRGFWVAGLTGRRMLLESWAYMPETFTRHGDGGLHHQYQPSSWPNRLLLSQQAIADPTPERMQLLRDAGVRWIFAVRRASPVSPALSTYADLVHSTGDVDVYRIRGDVAPAPGRGDLPDGGPTPASTPASTPPAPVVPAVR